LLPGWGRFMLRAGSRLAMLHQLSIDMVAPGDVLDDPAHAIRAWSGAPGQTVVGHLRQGVPQCGVRLLELFPHRLELRNHPATRASREKPGRAISGSRLRTEGRWRASFSSVSNWSSPGLSAMT